MKMTVLKSAIAGLALVATGVMAEEGTVGFEINGEIPIVTRVPAAAHLDGALSEAISGWEYRDSSTQAMQMDDFDNPAMLAVEQAAEVWNTAMGTVGKSCADCHGDVNESMIGIRATYPKWNEKAGEVRTLAMQVNNCLTENMGAEAWKYDGADMAAMEALISIPSRGMPVNVAIDGPVASVWEQGKEMYYTRYGQLELSCASCHELNYDNLIRADHLSQGQINAFPVYRLKDTGLVTTHGRFKGCVRDTRAETFAAGSPEFVALELYVASRGNGLSVEAPAVRP